ncbi:hypothetical protein J4208_00150 [Candidatus Woesearchaeota archaeon]|nr:hypothetical protein [Candidatus Woesearchaeota archaeon]
MDDEDKLRELFRNPQSADDLVTRVRKIGNIKDKSLIDPSEFKMLIVAGAELVRGNRPEAGAYLQEVKYKGIIFQTYTEEELDYNDN